MDRYEIEVSVNKAKNGNKNELMKLLEQYKPFIIKMAKQHNIRNYELQDLVQIGYAALLNAVAKYKTGSETFNPYAFSAIRNCFKYTLRQNVKHNGILSLNMPINSDENTLLEFIDTIESSDNLEEHILSSENTKSLKKALCDLSKVELKMLASLYGNKCSIKNYAENNGMKYMQAIRQKNQILEKLNSRLN